MTTEPIAEFNGYTPDELSALHRSDPERFEDLARAVISQACIGKTPEQTMKLWQLQWQIDGQLRKGKTPLHRMQIMEHIFYNRIFGEDGNLARLACGWKEMQGYLGQISHLPTRKPVLQLVKKMREAEEIGG